MKFQIKTSLLKILAVVILTLAAVEIRAQQTPLFNQYYLAESLAYTSSTVFEKDRYFRFVYRDQFGGLVGAPKNFALAYNGLIGPKSAYSFNATSIDIGFIDQFKINGGWGLKLIDKGRDGLALGAQVGLSLFGLNEDLVNPDNPADIVLSNILGQSGSSLNVDLSLTYQLKALRINAVLPNVVNESLSDDAYDQINDDNAADFMIGADYTFIISPKITVKPYLGIRTKEVLGAQVDVMTELSYQEKLMVYAGYREGYGASAGFGFQLSPRLLLTYSYDLGKKDVPFLADGQNEFGIHFRLNKRADVQQAKMDAGRQVINSIRTEEIFDEKLVSLRDKEKALSYLASLEEGNRKQRNIKAQSALDALFEKVKQEKLAKYEAARLAEVETLQPQVAQEQVTVETKEVIVDNQINTTELTKEKKEEIKKTLTLVTQSISFKTASAELTDISFASLDQVVHLMSENPTVKLELRGHTDNTGDQESNLKLSTDRAMSVKAYLAANGIDSARISARGYGSTVPISDNSTAEGRALNRRVEMEIQEQ